MKKPHNRIAGLIFIIAVASVYFWSFAQLRVAAEPQQANGTQALSQSLSQRFQWPVKPFHIIGNIYYVGLSTFDSYLIVTPKGDFLLDVAVPQDVRSGVEELGFKVADVKYLLNEHAHSDRVLGLAQMKQWTGAKVLAMSGDVPALEDGGAKTNILADIVGPVFPPIKIDRVIHDGEQVALGGTTLVAHLTPGHTEGCTTWTTDVEEKGKKYSVVLYGACASLNEPLVGNKNRPDIAKEYASQYRNLSSLDFDVPLGIESWEKMNAKAEMTMKNPGMENAFVDPRAWHDFIARNEKLFEDQLAKEKAGGVMYQPPATAGARCPQDARACYNLHDLIMDCCAKLGTKYVGKD